MGCGIYRTLVCAMSNQNTLWVKLIFVCGAKTSWEPQQTHYPDYLGKPRPWIVFSIFYCGLSTVTRILFLECNFNTLSASSTLPFTSDVSVWRQRCQNLGKLKLQLNAWPTTQFYIRLLVFSYLYHFSNVSHNKSPMFVDQTSVNFCWKNILCFSS